MNLRGKINVLTFECWMLIRPCECDRELKTPIIFESFSACLSYETLCRSGHVMPSFTQSVLDPAFESEIFTGCQWPHYNTHQHSCICVSLRVSKEFWLGLTLFPTDRFVFPLSFTANWLPWLNYYFQMFSYSMLYKCKGTLLNYYK